MRQRGLRFRAICGSAGLLLGQAGAFEAEEFSLHIPTQRKISGTSRKSLRGKFWRLLAMGNFFDDRRSQKSQPNDSTDVAFANSFALANLNQRTRAPG